MDDFSRHVKGRRGAGCPCPCCVESKDKRQRSRLARSRLKRDTATIIHEEESTMPVVPKPRDYFARRAWQDDARARGEDPECGRETCKAKAAPAWINKHTPLLYCEGCAWMINKWNDGFCSPEVK